MDKKLFSLVFVIVLGVLLGLIIVRSQKGDPALKELLQQQTKIMNAQQRMEAKLDTGGVGGNDTQVQFLVSQINDLRNKVSALESRLNSYEKIAKVPQQAAAQAVKNQVPPPPDPEQVYTIPADHSPVRGNPKAAVTLVEFVDFQCPYCAKFHPPILEVLKTYPNDVKYILKNFPLSFHPMARPASKAAFAAGEQGKYWEMADAILENSKNLSDEKFEELAKDIGLNVKKFKKDLKDNDEKYEEYIQKDMELASKVTVRGTPTMFLNGKKTNARDFAGYKREIDQLLKEKK
ncbi:MAG: thioredoxin domain-containing protein [Candidatus Omnitrophica bacterium]|nr:thioredoxin domain-containing protein [Candidatus Omnitrophota bacterium]